jgi:hypothetical protein
LTGAIDENEGAPVHASLFKNAMNAMVPVGLYPFVVETISEADAKSPRVMVLGYTDAVISRFALVIVRGTVAVELLNPLVTINSAM